jgi:hypothetical protein
MDTVASWSFEKRLGVVLQQALPKLGPEAEKELRAFLNPTSLANMAGVLGAWVASHAFGIGELIDILVMVLGAAAIGFAVFEAIDHLYDFAVGTYRATSTHDLERAADHFAKAVTILGIQATLAILFRGARAPRTRGARIEVGPAPISGGLRYKPTIGQDPTMAAGEGITSFWGDILVSSHGSAADRALVLLHEKVHQALSPRLFLLRDYRVSNRASSYVRSSLWRYLEEALAETVAQVGVNGFRGFFDGVKFPIKNGYLYLTKAGGFNPRFKGEGLVREGAALLRIGSTCGLSFQLWFEPTNVRPRTAHQQ